MGYYKLYANGKKPIKLKKNQCRDEIFSAGMSNFQCLNKMKYVYVIKRIQPLSISFDIIERVLVVSGCSKPSKKSRSTFVKRLCSP